jgi:FKBP-type peptidyl-prolyl cis-trans isomerase FklB
LGWHLSRKQAYLLPMKKSTMRICCGASGLVLTMAVAASSQAQNPTPAVRPPPSTAPGADPAPPPSPEQISYLIGLIFGAQVHNTGVPAASISQDALARGIREGLNGKAPTPEDQRQVQAFARSIGEAQAAKNDAAAKDFLAKNAKDKNVVTTASGLQYKILASGDKKAPPIGPTDKVTVHYRGKLLDGSEFDSSYSRNEPATFPVNGVIKGWQEALVMMKPGAKWQLFIPPDLAYGARAQAKIPPNSLLIFEVNLLSAESANAPPKLPPGTPPSAPHSNK